MLHTVPAFDAGENTTNPTLSTDGSRPVRNASMPAWAHWILVPPAVHAAPIDPVRSSTITMCAGIGLPPPMLAVAVAETDAELIPTTFANTVLTVADCVITIAFGVLFEHHTGTLPCTVRHFGVNVSDTPFNSAPAFF